MDGTDIGKPDCKMLNGHEISYWEGTLQYRKLPLWRPHHGNSQVEKRQLDPFRPVAWRLFFRNLGPVYPANKADPGQGFIQIGYQTDPGAAQPAFLLYPVNRFECLSLFSIISANLVDIGAGGPNHGLFRRPLLLSRFPRHGK